MNTKTKITKDLKLLYILGMISGLANSEEVAKKITEDINRSMISILETAMEEAMILCKHDSIPSYTAGKDSGCIRCQQNYRIQSILNSLKE